jgi:hypothetical protein
MTEPAPTEPSVTLEIVEPPPPPGSLPYRQVCISMYRSDHDALVAAVAKFHAAGITRMSASQLIRIALRRLDVDSVVSEMEANR